MPPTPGLAGALAELAIMTSTAGACAQQTRNDGQKRFHCTTREVVSYGLDRIDPERDIRIVLIEAFYTGALALMTQSTDDTRH